MARYLPGKARSKELFIWNFRLFMVSLIIGVLQFTDVSAQNFVISGKVTSSDDGAPLPGVTVLLKGSSSGTSTDSEGAFRLQVSDPNGTLVFSFIGYSTQEVSIGSKTAVDVVMTPDITELGEVVVVGYGTVKKTDLTGSVVTLDPEQITKRGSLNTMEAVQGQLPGVDISNETGRAGAPFRIQIRGQQNLQGGNPLYVVDGVITEGIDFLNPQDIERIDILKDASSTAIYGSRGAYGVVIVTTRQGASVKQKATVSYDGYVGVREVARLPKFMDGDKFWTFRQDAYITPAILNNQAYNENAGNNTNSDELRRRIAEKDYTDWPDLFIQRGTQANHWLTVSGMGDKMGYTFGAGYQEEKGNVVNENYKRYNFKASVNHTLSEQWSAGTTWNLSIVDHEKGSSNAMVNAFRMSPLLKPTGTETGELIIQPGKDVPYIDMTSSVNPLFEMENSANDTRMYYVIGNVFLQYNPLDWLSAKTTFAPRFRYQKEGQFLGTNTEGRVGLLPAASQTNTEAFSYVWDNQLSATKIIQEHSFNLMGLYSLNLFRDEVSTLSAINLPFNSGWHNLGSAPTTDQRASSNFTKSTIMSYALRLNYSWKDKYLVTMSTRWDGSSVLATGYKWASFPSAAVAWKISEENFLSEARFINNLKLRVSYGLTGNNSGVKPYSTQLQASNITLYDFDGTNASGQAPSGIVNRQLTWEKTNEVDAGVDFTLFNARLSGSVDYYNKLTTGILLSRQLPLEAGSPPISDNVGEVRNKGIEVALNAMIVSTRDFTWQTTLNFSRNENAIEKLITKDDDVGNKWFIGEPVRVNYTYVFDGIWQQEESELAKSYGQRVGQAKVKDFDDNGAITPTDRRIIGTPFPSWTGGLTTTFTYKGFDLSASLFTRQGVQVYSPFHNEFLNLNDRGRTKLDVDWYMVPNDVTPTRISNQYPQPQNVGPYWMGESGVASYKDASFTKVKNITLGYTFPSTLFQRARISNLRVYGNVLNPFVFTKYDGFDPEWADATYANGGMSSITYQFGINLKF